MINFISKLVTILFFSLVLYLLGCSIAIDWNPAQWNAIIRGILATILVIICLKVIVANLD